jgi:hypothetical protein
MKAALAQFTPAPGQISENISSMSEICLSAITMGAKLIVFSELSACGVPNTYEEAVKYSQSPSGYITQWFEEIANTHDCTIVFGCIEIVDGFCKNAIVSCSRGFTQVHYKENLSFEEMVWATEDDSIINCSTSGLLLNFPEKTIQIGFVDYLPVEQENTQIFLGTKYNATKDWKSEGPRYFVVGTQPIAKIVHSKLTFFHSTAETSAYYIEI